MAYGESEGITTRVVGSPFVPDGWMSFRNANGQTVCVVMVTPNYRILYGDPYDDTICATVVNINAFARYAHEQMMQQQLALCEPANTLAC